MYILLFNDAFIAFCNTIRISIAIIYKKWNCIMDIHSF